MMKIFHNIFVSISFSLAVTSIVTGQQIAFPGAEGYGKIATGGRGGVVLEVTNLDDNGPGSLRAAVEASGPRTIVFRVSGTIYLESRLEINNNDITIAGQTAPGDGICVAKRGTVINADNVIIRYLRFRLGVLAWEPPAYFESDALSGDNKKIIIDHCTVSWSTDEVLSLYGTDDLTIQWTLISEGLREPSVMIDGKKWTAHSKGPHGYGGIWGGERSSFHHNMFAHNDSRNPRFDRADRNNDFRNNVIYNWGGNSVYGGEGGNYNLIKNYYKSGPATKTDYRVAEAYQDAYNGFGRWYIDGNYVDGYPDVTADNWNGGVAGGAERDIRAYEPFDYSPVVTHTPENAYELVLADVGASLKRDIHDTRIAEEARTGTATYGGESYGAGTGIIDSQEDVGGYPTLNTYDIITDDDHDGMADDWEAGMGLSASDPEDRNEDLDGDGFTNLEEYLNSLCERTDYLAAPAELKSITISHESVRLRWREAVPGETGFEIERSIDDTTSFTVVATANANDTLFVDTGLSPLTAYYYRIRAINSTTQSIYTGAVTSTTLSVTGEPLKADEPQPDTGEAGVEIDVVLGWGEAIGAQSYDVYVGESNPPEFIATITDPYYTPHFLLDTTHYFWRVDPINDNGTTEGTVWEFTTAAFTEGLIGSWAFERGSGNLEFDDSGNYLFAYLLNMGLDSWKDGIDGKSLFFDGMDDYLRVNNNDIIDISVRGFTVSFWMAPLSTTEAFHWVSKALYEDAVLARGYDVCYRPDLGKVMFSVSDGEVSASAAGAADPFTSGHWTFVTAVRDRISGQLRLYADAQLVASTIDTTWNIATGEDLYISTTSELNSFFEGRLDELKIFNYPLDTTEIRIAYEAGIETLDLDYTNPLPYAISIDNYPNPFNNSTIINYTIAETGYMSLAVFNLLGQQVLSIVNDMIPSGNHSLRFSGDNLPSGIYYVRLMNGGQSKIRKMLLLK
ncbi:LamG-like jellyroll fold domain-containing protein [Candidatus Neomarinimicrobiota bacterium]